MRQVAAICGKNQFLLCLMDHQVISDGYPLLLHGFAFSSI